MSAEAETNKVIIEKFKSLYDEKGIDALSRSWLLKNGHRKIYEQVLASNLSIVMIADHLSLLKELNLSRREAYKRIRLKWTPEKINETALALIDEFGMIPTVPWLQRNGYGKFVWYIEQQQSISEFRDRYYKSETNRLLSRANIAHDSFAEVCFANFLWARGIDPKKGGKYESDFAKTSSYSSAVYDIEFIATFGQYEGHKILVEIWGDSKSAGPNGHNLEEYLAKKAAKIKYHENNPYFLGLGYENCYTEKKLIDILQPYIGKNCKISRTKENHDFQFPPTMWTLADEVIKTCKFVCHNMPDNILPALGWFKRSDTYKCRPVLDWEPETWGRFPCKINQVGGILKLREVLGQKQHNKITHWTKDNVTQALADFYTTYRVWPTQILKLQSPEITSDTYKSIEIIAKRLREAANIHIGNIFEYQAAAGKLISADIFVDYKKRPALPSGVRWKGGNAKYTAWYKGKCIGSFQKAAEASSAYQEVKKRL